MSVPGDSNRPPDPPVLPEEVRLLCSQVPRISQVLRGVGLPKTRNTEADYDFAFLVALIREGVTGPDTLAEAIAYRIAIRHREETTDYPAEVVGRALRATSSTVQIDRFIIYDTDPPVYEIAVGPIRFQVTIEQLGSISGFQRRWAQVMREFPAMPKEKEDWFAIVNRWMKAAEIVVQPPEASKQGFLAGAVADALDSMAEGTSKADLERGLYLTRDAGRCFAIRPLFVRLRATFSDVTVEKLSAVLRDLGAQPCAIRVDGHGGVRTWRTACPPASSSDPPEPEKPTT